MRQRHEWVDMLGASCEEIQGLSTVGTFRPKRVSTESAPSTLETRLGDFASIEKMAGNFRIADDPG
jgi:hypothetical protein